MGTDVKEIPVIRQVFYDVYASLPSVGIRTGDLAYATDRKVLYRWNGTVWDPITFFCGSGLASAIPTASDLPDGSLYIETDTAAVKQIQSGAWVTIAYISGFSTGVSSNLRNSNDAEKNTALLVYTKIKEVKLNAALANCTIKFDGRAGTGGTFYARIYKNGVAIGTEKTGSSDTYTTYSQNFAGLAADDLIQIYAYCAATAAYVKNMRFYYDRTIIGISGETLGTPLGVTTDPTISMTNQDP